VQLDSQVLVGEISLAPAYDLVLFRRGETRTVLPAHKLKSLYFYDAGDDINRRYVSVKIDDGVRSVRRKKLNAIDSQNESLDYSYYIHFNDEFLTLRKFKRKLYKNQLQADERIQRFVAAQRLTAALPEHVLQIIKYYNGLFQSNEQLAKN
jgi:hypothetical protein